MKKILKLIPIIMAAIAVFAVSAFGWLAGYSVVKFPTNFGGSMKTEYFAGGDGSKDYPYIISSPVHFYNLAWLQYLGYFNLGEYINNGRAQSFFKLDFNGANLNLQGLALPPIGTREYPFIGNFDGNGKTISNFTVSNSKTDLVKRPLAAVFSGDYLNTTRRRSSEIVDILGLFGVTGDFKSSLEGVYADKEVAVKTDTSTETKAVSIHKKVDGGSSLESLPSGNVAENEFYYSGMDVHSFYIDKIKVHSVAENALIGLAAGYVGSTIENVGVYRSKVTVSGNTISGATGIKKSSGADVSYDGVISNYSIVGDYDDEIVGWTEAPGGGNTSGDAATWGGSIDMKMINRRINYMFTEGAIRTSGTSNEQRTSISDSFNTQIRLSLDNEFYWRSPEKEPIVAYLEGETYIPLNVDKVAMKLDREEGDGYDDVSATKQYKGKNVHTNSYYSSNSSEIVDINSNSGYLVGSSGGARLRIQSLNGIYQSLGTVMNPSEFSGDSLILLSTSADGETIYRIDNPSVTTVNPYFDQEPKCQVKYPSDYKYYSSVRNNFIESMSTERYIHGFHFDSVIPTGEDIESIDKLSVSNVLINGVNYENYQFVKGSLNFSVKTNNMLRVIVGTYFQNSGHSLFDLFKIERADNGNISGISRIKKIYQNGNGDISYDENTVDGELIIDFEAINTKKALKKYKAAYYFEIPVIGGQDYLIGGIKNQTSNTPYLMYLDIGANGSETSGGTTKGLPYIMKSVDFVSMSSDDTSDTLTVPNNQTTFPIYADVGFRLGAATDVIYFRREDYSGTVTEDAAFTTVVNYWRENAVIAVTVTPTIFGAEDNKAKWED